MRRDVFTRMAPLLLTLVSACGGSGQTPPNTPEGPAADPAAADVELFPINRSKVRGTIRIVKTAAGLELRGRLTGLHNGKYGFGVREGASCGPNGSTAGTYYEGGNRTAPLGHLEDLFIEKEDGTNVVRVEPNLQLSGPHSIVGRTLVIEAWPTDPKVDPVTVPMIACGAIQAE